MDELELPKSQQRLSEDFFLEMERALKTVTARLPYAIPDLEKARDVLIDKYQKGVISNITDFRKLRKIATSTHNVGMNTARVNAAIKRVIDPDKNVGILDVFEESFESKYDKRKALRSIDLLENYLGDLNDGASGSKLDPDLRQRLEQLRQILDSLLGGA
jgi:hypothetical protein